MKGFEYMLKANHTTQERLNQELSVMGALASPSSVLHMIHSWLCRGVSLSKKEAL